MCQALLFWLVSSVINYLICFIYARLLYRLTDSDTTKDICLLVAMGLIPYLNILMILINSIILFVVLTRFIRDLNIFFIKKKK